MTARSVVHRSTVAVLAAGLVLVGACGRSDDDDDAAAAADDGPVSVADAWARTTPPGTTVGAVYLRVSSDTADVLVGADVESSIAASAVLHSTTTSTSGQTSMEPLGQLEVPAGGELVLEPAGHHIMLVDLVGPLDDGDSFDLTLHFGTADDETVAVEVRDEAP